MKKGTFVAMIWGTIGGIVVWCRNVSCGGMK